MNEKIYKFSYGNKVKEFISKSVFALYNLMWGLHFAARFMDAFI